MRHADGLEGGAPKNWGRKSRKTRGNRQTNWRAGARPNRSERWWMSGRIADQETDRTGSSSNTKVRSAAPPARPGGLDNVGGSLERRVYSPDSRVGTRFESPCWPIRKPPGMEVAGFTPIVESQPALVARIAQEQDKWKKVIERIKW